MDELMEEDDDRAARERDYADSLRDQVSGGSDDSSTSSGSSGADPQVTDLDSERSITGAVDAYVLVSNRGGDGDVEVTLTVVDENGNTLERMTEIAHLRDGENKRVDFRFDPPRGGDRFTAEAEPL